MENVRGMMTIENRRILRDIHAKLGEYKVNVLYEDAADYGVPQHRKRIFVIGNRLGLENPVMNPTHFDPTRVGLTTKMRPYVTMKDAISDLPKVKLASRKNEMKYRAKPKTEYQRARRRHSKYVLNHISRNHCQRHVELFKMLKEGEWLAKITSDAHPYRKDIFQDRIKRQHWNKPSSTIMAHIHKDGLMFIHPEQLRTLTPREAARIQSFNDRYLFAGKQTSIYRQVGNAVPPLMAKAIAKDIRKLLCVALPVLIHSRKYQPAGTLRTLDF
jgi:DNA (cytosine-5)-methyltransferase 1